MKATDYYHHSEFNRHPRGERLAGLIRDMCSHLLMASPALPKSVMLFVIVMCAAKVSAQNAGWFETGDTWIYNYQIAFEPGHHQAIFQVTEQTQFAGKDCAKVEVVSEDESPFPCSAVQPPYYFYTSGDSVFYASENDSVFHLAYDFGAEVDDVWNYIVPVQEPDISETFVDTFEARVVNTSILEVDGQVLRRMELSYTYLGQGDPHTTLLGEGNASVLEFIGSESEFIVPFGDYMVFSACDGEFGGNLQCFESETLNYLNPDFDSCVLSVDKSQDRVRFDLYPNPARNKIIIRAEANEKNVIGVYDISGRRLAGFPLFGSYLEYDISNLAKGTYVVKLQNPKTTITRLLLKD